MKRNEPGEPLPARNAPGQNPSASNVPALSRSRAARRVSLPVVLVICRCMINQTQFAKVFQRLSEQRCENPRPEPTAPPTQPRVKRIDDNRLVASYTTQDRFGNRDRLAHQSPRQQSEVG